MQIEQKKVPVFHVEKEKDTLTVIVWCNHIKAMKNSLGVVRQCHLLQRATAALFGNT